jgi:hypothetical protein
MKAETRKALGAAMRREIRATENHCLRACQWSWTRRGRVIFKQIEMALRRRLVALAHGMRRAR